VRFQLRCGECFLLSTVGDDDKTSSKASNGRRNAIFRATDEVLLSLRRRRPTDGRPAASLANTLPLGLLLLLLLLQVVDHRAPLSALPE